MMFDGIRPEQIGRVKVLSVSDRFSAPRAQQTVARGGVILASVSVPTVREIIVELLVRGKSVEDVHLTMRRLAKWLEAPKMARLQLRHTDGTYYKARCTDIGPATYSGASAKLTVVFTCDDYRLYHLYNDMPVEGADPDTDNFTFAGKHCLRDMGCMFVVSKRTGVPQAQAHKYEISGLPGTLRYDAPELALKEGKITGTLYFVGRSDDGLPLSAREAEERLHSVASWLIAARRADLIWDSDITRVVLAEMDTEASLDRADWENGKLSVTMAVQPLAMDARQSVVTKDVALSAGNWQDIDLSEAFPRGMGYTTPLVLEITNAGSARVTDLRIGYTDALGARRETRFCGAGFGLSAGQTLRVDGESAYSSIGGTNAAAWLYSGDYPSVSPGMTGIELQADVSVQVSVRAAVRARWV